MTQLLEKAKNELLGSDNACVALCGEAIVSAQGRGVKPLMQWLEQTPCPLAGASVADRVVGKAAALLMLCGPILEVWAGVVSRPALDCFAKAGVACFYDRVVERISNRDQTGLCPMEERCMTLSSPQEALRVLKDALAQLP